jgi:hypothetical protein
MGRRNLEARRAAGKSAGAASSTPWLSTESAKAKTEVGSRLSDLRRDLPRLGAAPTSCMFPPGCLREVRALLTTLSMSLARGRNDG